MTLLAADARRRVHAQNTLSFRRIRLGRIERDFPGNAMEIGFPPTFLGSLYGRHHFADATPCVIELAEFDIGLGQIG